MCGIAGIIDFRGQPVDSGILRRMGNVLHHRGPDDTGMLVEARSHRPAVGFVHKRLSIIDLTRSGRQPMSNEDDTIFIVMNGEIYNFRELRKELVSRGHIFKSMTDTEVILHLYEEKGQDLASYLEGMFAFALWDTRDGKILLCRDRMGKKPLFFTRAVPNKLIFASEIKGIIASNFLKPEMDPAALPLYLTLGFVPTPRSLYKHIEKLEPGTVMVFDSTGESETRRFWKLESKKTGIVKELGTEEEYSSRLRLIMTEAVRRRLVADVPLGAFLSGGLDSTIIVGIMSKLMDRPVKTFTIGFSGGKGFDETQYADIAAKEFKTEHMSFIVEPELFKEFRNLLWFHDEPYGDSSALPTYIVSKMTREFVTVALNGDGGDEIFAGYPRFKAVMLAEKIPSLFIKFVSGMLPKTDSNGLHARVKRLADKAQNPFPVNLLHWICNIETGIVREILSKEIIDLSAKYDYSNPEESFRRRVDELGNGSLLDKILYVNMRTYLLDDLLVKMDRMSMAASLETRSPFLDRELVEFSMSIPDNMKIRGRTMKYLLRKAFANLVPTEILYRAKQGFGVPLGDWFRNELKDFTVDLLSDPNSIYREYFDHERVLELVKVHMEGRKDMSRLLWTMVNLETWLRNIESMEFMEEHRK